MDQNHDRILLSTWDNSSKCKATKKMLGKPKEEVEKGGIKLKLMQWLKPVTTCIRILAGSSTQAKSSENRRWSFSRTNKSGVSTGWSNCSSSTSSTRKPVRLWSGKSDWWNTWREHRPGPWTRLPEPNAVRTCTTEQRPPVALTPKETRKLYGMMQKIYPISNFWWLLN